MRVLHVAMECLPYSKVGGMADVTGALPGVLAALGHECRVLTPYYPQIWKGPVGKELASFEVWVGSAPHRVRLLEAEPYGILVDQPTALDRPGCSGPPARTCRTRPFCTARARAPTAARSRRSGRPPTT